jgi:tRNA A64-2'-O-ribosylphosphate transferase
VKVSKLHTRPAYDAQAITATLSSLGISSPSTMAQPSQASRYIFSESATDIAEVLASLKRSNLSITNRLLSVTDDAEFVCHIADTFRLPLIANERCGSWYIPPEHKVESAYFKSTDGHTGQWQFSLRRLNVQVLDVVGKYDGCVGDFVLM